VTIKDAISDRHFCHMTTSYCGDGIEKTKTSVSFNELEAPFRRPLFERHTSNLPNLFYLFSFAEKFPAPWRNPWGALTHPYTCYLLGVVLALTAGGTIAGIDIIYGHWTQNLAHKEDELASSMGYNNKLAWVAIVVGAVALFSNWLFPILLTHAAHVLSSGLRREYFAASLVQDPTYYDSHGPGAITTYANRDVSQVHAALGEKLGFLLNAIGTVLACVIMALSKAPNHAGVLLALLFFSVLTLTILGMLAEQTTG